MLVVWGRRVRERRGKKVCFVLFCFKISYLFICEERERDNEQGGRLRERGRGRRLPKFSQALAWPSIISLNAPRSLQLWGFSMSCPLCPKPDTPPHTEIFECLGPGPPSDLSANITCSGQPSLSMAPFPLPLSELCTIHSVALISFYFF